MQHAFIYKMKINMSDISRDLRIGVQCYNVRSCEWCILYAATKLKMAMHDVYCVCV